MNLEGKERDKWKINLIVDRGTPSRTSLGPLTLLRIQRHHLKKG